MSFRQTVMVLTGFDQAKGTIRNEVWDLLLFDLESQRITTETRKHGARDNGLLLREGDACVVILGSIMSVVMSSPDMFLSRQRFSR